MLPVQCAHQAFTNALAAACYLPSWMTGEASNQKPKTIFQNLLIKVDYQGRAKRSIAPNSAPKSNLCNKLLQSRGVAGRTEKIGIRPTRHRSTKQIVTSLCMGVAHKAAFLTQGFIMRLMTLLLASTIFAAPAFAQKAQSSSNPNAAQVKGNTEIKADQKNVTAVAVGVGNVAKNTAGAIKGGTQIQGNTKIKASQKNSTAVAVGINSTSTNETGVIGGK